MSVEKLRYWCHKILPLVYDESLSYYEVLCKMKATINEVITVLNQMEETIGSLEDLTREVLEEYMADHPEVISNAVAAFILANPEVIETAVLTEITEHPEWIEDVVTEYLADNLHIPFYNVADYGILPNNNVYSALHDLLKTKVAATGGIVYFPRGKYTIDYTIFIPANTMFIGEGYRSEIYFDETDTTFGVALANAGDAVTIKNMKVSQKSNGTFSSGAQPGCIGLSNTSIDNVYENEYSHTFPRWFTKNLVVENVWIDGNYAIQVENNSEGKIENVIIRNIYCPSSTISLAPWAEINSVLIENVDCDLLRIFDNHKTLPRTGVRNLTCINSRANTLYVSDYHGADDTGFTFINFEQKATTKNNDVLSSTYCAALSCNAKFENCKFYARTTETDGVGLWYGQIEFNKCVFDMYSHIVYPNISVTNDESYALYMNDCTISNRASSPAITVLMGYGSNNTIKGSNIVRRLWGDMDDYYPMFENVSQSTHPNRVIANNKELILRVYTVITNGTISAYPTRLSQFPCDFTCIPCVIWNSSNRVGTTINTFLSVDSGNIVIGETGINAANYDRLMIHAPIPITGTPTVKQIHNLLT